MNSLPTTVTRLRRHCDLNPGPSAPESSTLTTRLPSYRRAAVWRLFLEVIHKNVHTEGKELCQKWTNVDMEDTI